MSGLKLRYAFHAQPNPIIQVSTAADPKVVDLVVMVSNPNPTPVEISDVTITIPVGMDGAGELSASPALPQPTGVSVGWETRVNGGAVEMSPVTGSQVKLGSDPIAFTICRITVGTCPGTVQIRIDESVGGKVRTDNRTYTLTKWPSGFPVLNFYANPAILYDLGKTVVLYWECDPTCGQDYVYMVRADSWQPQDCLNEGQCYTSDAGGRGVPTEKVNATTTFYLDVITTTDGTRTVAWTLRTTVTVNVPSISQDSRVTVSPSGNIAVFQWVAFNAVSCSLFLNGSELPDAAPTDTYDTGYAVLLGSGTGPLLASLKAYGIADTSGAAPQATFVFGQIKTTDNTTTINVDRAPDATAITPDSTTALVVCTDDNYLDVVNLDSQQVTTVALDGGFGSWATPVTITPDGMLGLVVSNPGNLVNVVDLAQCVKEPSIAVGGAPIAIAVTATADGELGLVLNYTYSDITVIELPSLIPESNVITLATDEPRDMTVTADGLALVIAGPQSSDEQNGCLVVVDIAKRSVEEKLVISPTAIKIVVTPDSSLAVILNSDGTLTFVDVPSRTVSQPSLGTIGNIPPLAIAMAPDGRYVLVTFGDSANAGLVVPVDIVARKVGATTWPVGLTPLSIAIAPNGTFSVAANSGDDTVSIT